MGKNKLESRARASFEREQRVDQYLTYGKWGGLFALVISLAVAVSWNLSKGPLVEILNDSSPDKLQEVFFGGSPWLLLCSDSRKALLSDGRIRKPLLQAAESLQPRVNTGALDCSRTLPSGKTIYERLKLNETRAPVLFLSLGGDRPLQLAPSLLQSKSTAQANSNKKKQEDITKNELVKRVEKSIEDRYALRPIKDSKSLQDKCIDRRVCALFLTSGKPSSTLKTLVHFASKALPLYRWMYIDSTLYQINIEKELMGGQPFNRNALRVVVFKNKRYLTFPDTTSTPQGKAIREFLGTAAVQDQESFAILKKIPQMKRRSAAPDKKTAKKPTEPRKKNHQNEKRDSKTTRQQEAKAAGETQREDDDKMRLTPEEAEELRREREQEVRRKMEEEASAFEPVFNQDDDTEEEEEFEEEEEEEDLDDLDEEDIVDLD